MPTYYDRLHSNIDSLSSEHFIKLGREGLCHCLACLCGQDSINYQIARFESILSLLTTDPEKKPLRLGDKKFDSFKKTYNSIQEKLKNSQPLIREEENFLRSLMPFLDSGLVIHASSETELKDIIPLQDFGKAFLLTAPDSSENRLPPEYDRLPPIYNQQIVIYKKGDLIPHIIDGIVKSGVHNFAIFVSSTEHTIFIGDIEGKKVIFDANYLNIPEEENLVIFKDYTTTELFECMLVPDKQKTPVSITVYSSPAKLVLFQAEDLHTKLLRNNENYRKIYPLACSDLSATDSNSHTLIAIAALSNRERLLPDNVSVKPTDVNRKGADGTTAFLLATSRNNYTAAHALLSLGADPNFIYIIKSANKEISYPIAYIAAEWGYDQILKDLIEHNANITLQYHSTKLDAVGSSNELSTYIIHAAVEKGHLSTVKLLLTHPKLADQFSDPNFIAGVNAKDSSGETPLIMATQKNYLNIMEVLIAHHADINQANDMGSTPLFMATKYKNHDAMWLLIAHGASPNVAGYTSPLLQSIINNDELAFENLLNAQGIDINYSSPQYGTALSYAVREGKEEIAKKLIQCGATADDSILLDAVYSQQIETINLVIKHFKPSINYEENDCTPLITAINSRNEASVRLLISLGASVHFQTQHGYTALMAAVETENPNLINLILKAGANPNEKNLHDLLPVTQCIIQGKFEIAEVLLAHTTMDLNSFSKDLLQYIQNEILATQWLQMEKLPKLISTTAIEKGKEHMRVPAIIGKIHQLITQTLAEKNPDYLPLFNQLEKLFLQGAKQEKSVILNLFKSNKAEEKCMKWLSWLDNVKKFQFPPAQQNSQKPSP